MNFVDRVVGALEDWDGVRTPECRAARLLPLLLPVTKVCEKQFMEKSAWWRKSKGIWVKTGNGDCLVAVFIRL